MNRIRSIPETVAIIALAFACAVAEALGHALAKTMLKWLKKKRKRT